MLCEYKIGPVPGSYEQYYQFLRISLLAGVSFSSDLVWPVAVRAERIVLMEAGRIDSGHSEMESMQ